MSPLHHLFALFDFVATIFHIFALFHLLHLLEQFQLFVQFHLFHPASLPSWILPPLAHSSLILFFFDLSFFGAFFKFFFLFFLLCAVPLFCSFFAPHLLVGRAEKADVIDESSVSLYLLLGRCSDGTLDFDWVLAQATDVREDDHHLFGCIAGEV